MSMPVSHGVGSTSFDCRGPLKHRNLVRIAYMFPVVPLPPLDRMM